MSHLGTGMKLLQGGEPLVTEITAEAKWDSNANTINVAGQCWAHYPNTPAAGNLVSISSDWGATAQTQSTQTLGQFLARLVGSSANVGQKVTVAANGTTRQFVVTN
jgi:hypothetical protein